MSLLQVQIRIRIAGLALGVCACFAGGCAPAVPVGLPQAMMPTPDPLERESIEAARHEQAIYERLLGSRFGGGTWMFGRSLTVSMRDGQWHALVPWIWGGALAEPEDRKAWVLGVCELVRRTPGLDLSLINVPTPAEGFALSEDGAECIFRG